ncbi:preprotein translocase subunit YajC [Candidatus Poribacteria bacterium]|nr:preprotein translocase subunit YajC [Candidatus Poribacteria bacterium]
MPGCASGDILSMLTFIVPMFLILYFLFWRPQQQQRRKHQNMLNSLARGDEVVTTGGLHGSIIGVKDDVVVMKIAEIENREDVKVEVSKSAIAFLKKGGELVEGE